MRRFSQAVAYAVVHRPRLVITIAASLVLGCAWVLHSRQNFDSEVLNLLPQRFESVQALRSLNTDYVQGRELTFAVRGEPEVVADFAEHLVERLRAEPWVVRVFHGSPLETEEGIETLRSLLPALLLNLDADQFREALAHLEPAAIAARIRRLREEIEAGSAKGELIAANDPLGLLGAAMRPLSSMAGAEAGSALGSADGRFLIIPVVTSQPSLSQPDCKKLMQQAERFVSAVRSSWPGEAAPEVLVTGRSAYVAQISTSMERDVQVTSIVSVVMVGGLFFLGFRRLLPLLGIMVTLGLSCLAAFALGCLCFESLNMIAIAFCSILVGLGDDFSLLLYNRYLQARAAAESHEAAIASALRDMGPGILYVSLTTGIGFLVLVFSGSAGFAQLGVLIAIGIVLCGLFMMTLLFLFIRPQMPEPSGDFFGRWIGAFAEWSARNVRAVAGTMALVAAACIALALWPGKPLRFDTSPRSLEPKQIPAARALKAITENIAAASEPVIVMIEATNAQEAHDRWAAATAHWEKLVDRGELKGFSGPGALMISPARVRENQHAIASFNLSASEVALESAIGREKLNAEAFAGAKETLQRLGAAVMEDATKLSDLRASLPASSSWWFLIDRFFSTRGHAAVAYLRPAQPPVTAEDQARLETLLRESSVPMRVTGWSYAMVSLVPWAKRELVLFSGGVAVLVILVLAMAYRDRRALLIHAASLLFAISATVAVLKLAGLQINMLNALAFPLVLGVGVDYGLHLLLACRERGDRRQNLLIVLKPLVICGLTTVTGFGSLILARNPALSGLGLVCALGVACCLITSLFFVLPLGLWIMPQRKEDQ